MYQQHLGEWDISLSEPSCFSYNHALKAFQNLIVWRKFMQKFIMHYVDIVS